MALNRVLFPYDGSDAARRALGKLVQQLLSMRHIEVLLLNVQPVVPVRKLLLDARLSTVRRLQASMRDAGMKLLAGAGKALDAAGIPYQSHVAFGDTAPAIVSFAERYHCDQIFMSTRGMGRVRRLLIGSVANKVLHLARVPVQVVK